MREPALCLFDLGDVAARYLPERRLPALTTLLGAEPEAVTERIFASGLSREFDAGAFSLDGMARELAERFAVPVDANALMRVWCLAFRPDAAVLGLAERVGRRSRVGLLSNNPPAVEAGLARHLPAVARAFGLRLFSSSLGVRKPARALFPRVEQLVGLRGGEIALVDDSAANVDAANAHGWQAVHFTGSTALARELGRRGWLARDG